MGQTADVSSAPIQRLEHADASCERSPTEARVFSFAGALVLLLSVFPSSSWRRVWPCDGSGSRGFGRGARNVREVESSGARSASGALRALFFHGCADVQRSAAFSRGRHMS